MDIKAIFERYKELHPNSAAVYNPLNVEQWQYAIKQAERRPIVDALTIEPNEKADQLKAARSFEYWEEIPKYMQFKYLLLADMFAGTQVCALGSRINGTYIEAWSDNKLRSFRSEWGKSDKIESDYDFTLLNPMDGYKSIFEVEKDNLMFKADLLPNILKERKINVPMWNFDLLPMDKKAEARQLFEAKKWGALMKMHNDYKLSLNQYCFYIH